jgi:hypothetical protein
VANDESNNSNNNDDENPSSTLEQLLIVQAQLLETVQQILVQMQGVNLLMQSMEERPSSGKIKSNTQDDVHHKKKINAIKKAAQNHKEGSTSAKTTMTCLRCGQVGHYVNRYPEPRQSSTPTSHPNISQATMDVNQV